MVAPWYRQLFPVARIGPWKDTEAEIQLTARGGRIATSIGGTLTGRGADIILIDDPLKPVDALSDVKRNAVNDWYASTLVSRLNDKNTGAIVIVTQRTHADDLVGHVLATGGDDWTLLELPAIAFAEQRVRIGDNRWHIRPADDVLHPARESRRNLDLIRRDLGASNFAAQYLQAPAPPGGNLFRRAWLSYYDGPVIRSNDDIVFQSWDTASKAGVQNDWSVCTTWLLRRGHYYLIDLFRARIEYPDLRRVAIERAQAFNVGRVLVEDAGVGSGLIADLKAARISAVAIRPDTAKVARASVATAPFEAGRVLFPRSAPWLPTLEHELLAFPGDRHDDQVDSIAQALNHKHPAPTRVIGLA